MSRIGGVPAGVGQGGRPDPTYVENNAPHMVKYPPSMTQAAGMEGSRPNPGSATVESRR